MMTFSEKNSASKVGLDLTFPLKFWQSSTSFNPFSKMFKMFKMMMMKTEADGESNNYLASMKTEYFETEDKLKMELIETKIEIYLNFPL